MNNTPDSKVKETNNPFAITYYYLTAKLGLYDFTTEPEFQNDSFRNRQSGLKAAFRTRFPAVIADILVSYANVVTAGDVKECVQRFWFAFNRSDFDTIDAMYSEDATAEMAPDTDEDHDSFSRKELVAFMIDQRELGPFLWYHFLGCDVSEDPEFECKIKIRALPQRGVDICTLTSYMVRRDDGLLFVKKVYFHSFQDYRVFPDSERELWKNWVNIYCINYSVDEQKSGAQKEIGP